MGGDDRAFPLTMAGGDDRVEEVGSLLIEVQIPELVTKE